MDGLYSARMPLYEYRCGTCSREFERLVFGSERPACPSCGSQALEKLLSTFAAHARGEAAPRSAPGPCGSCGDPRGPGACDLD